MLIVYVDKFNFNKSCLDSISVDIERMGRERDLRRRDIDDPRRERRRPDRGWEGDKPRDMQESYPPHGYDERARLDSR